jgi:hypothetical protein
MCKLKIIFVKCLLSRNFEILMIQFFTKLISIKKFFCFLLISFFFIKCQRITEKEERVVGEVYYIIFTTMFPLFFKGQIKMMKKKKEN